MSDSNKPGGSNPADDLQRLRELILGKQGTHLDALYRRIEDPESRTGDVAEVLPDAMHRVVADPVTQPKIEQPIVDTIRGAIKRDTESFAEALFPVLGPAIRRAVSDALKALVQRINAALEHSFTVKGLRWRLEAARSGVPFAQIVLRETMLYAVQEVFLIQPHSGLLLARARRADALVLDEDAFSAMLTAIQAFIQDSLGMPEGEKLRSAELGDQSLWVLNGPKAALACLVIGSPPHDVRNRLMDTLETLHAHFGDQLDLPPEQLRDRPAIELLLEETLSEEMADGNGGKNNTRARLLWGLAGLTLLAFLAWGTWQAYENRQLEQEITRLFEAQPGYVLAAHDTGGGKLHFRGLRDPLTETPEALLQNANITTQDVTLSFRPYQSLEKDFVLRRLRASLGEGGMVTLLLDGSTLKVSGSLTSSQHAVLKSLPGSHPLIAAVDVTPVRLAPGEAVAQARRKLDAPDSVSISATKDRLMLDGFSNAAWYREAVANAGPVGGWLLDFTPLRAALADRMKVLQGNINGQIVMFSRMLELSTSAPGQLDKLGQEIREMLELATVLDTGLAIRLEGSADGVGDSDINRELALDRARLIQSELVNRGVDPHHLTIAAGSWRNGQENAALRKVIVQLTLDPPR